MAGRYRPEAIRRRERGVLKIDNEYIETFCDALEISGLERRQLIELARVFSLQFDSWNTPTVSNAERHFEFWNRVTCASTYFSYEPVLIPWIKQTQRYAYEVIKLHGANHIDAMSGSSARIELSKAVQSRQAPEIENFKTDRFEGSAICVMHEDALYRQVGGPGAMLEQIESLTEEKLPKHIEIKILPRSKALTVAAFFGFNLFGDFIATFETAAGAIHVADEATLSWLQLCANTLKSEGLALNDATSLINQAKEFYATR